MDHNSLDVRDHAYKTAMAEASKDLKKLLIKSQAIGDQLIAAQKDDQTLLVFKLMRDQIIMLKLIAAQAFKDQKERHNDQKQ